MNTELALSADQAESHEHCCCICGLKLLPIEEGLSGVSAPGLNQYYCLKCWFLAWRGYPSHVHHSREHFGYSGVTQTAQISSSAKSLAVLPLENNGEGGESDCFCESLSEDLIGQLSKISGIRVICWSSVSDYRNSDKALREICAELGTSMVLTGSARQEKDKLELTVNLSDGATGESLWQETFEGSISDYFGVQGKVVKGVASALKAVIEPEEARRISLIPTENIAAYQHYLRARRELDGHQKERNEKAIEYLNKALELDPDFSLAYAGLAEAYVQRVHRHGSSKTWLDSSVEMAEKAIDLDSDLAEAHSTLSLVYYLKGWFSQALIEDRKAVAINSNLPSAIYGLGYDYLVLGDLAETVRWLKRAVTIDPRDAGNHQQIGWILTTLGKFSEAEWWFKRSLQLQPEYEEARHQLGYLYLGQGKHEAANAEAEQILEGSPESLYGLDLSAAVKLKLQNWDKAAELSHKILEMSSMGASHLAKVAAYQLGYVLWAKGRKQEGSRLFEIQIKQHREALKKGDQSWIPRFFLASISAVQGRKEEACKWLRRAIAAGFRNSSYFDLYQDWDRMRNHEEFEEMLAKLKGDLEKMRRRAEAMNEGPLPHLVEGTKGDIDQEDLSDSGKE